MRIAFKNFGCRANSFETDALYLEAIRRNMVVVSDREVADAYVINSCTVTENADRDARNQVYRFRRTNPFAQIAVIGCYAQVAKEDLLQIDGVNYVVGTADKVRVLDLLTRSQPRDQVGSPTGYLPLDFPGSRHARASIKIQDGCNYRCSYCAIPLARGRSRSLPPQIVEQQVLQAAERGFTEVVLTGIHIAHYGWDHDCDLRRLVERLLSVPGAPRIRVSTLDPFEIPDGLLDLMAGHDKFCPYLHIALQSGDDAVLSRMRRLYRAQEFAEVTEQAFLKVPDIFVGVDVIVGFPGETEASFKSTGSFLAGTQWSKLHVFSFSQRRETEAERLQGKVSAGVIAGRSKALREVSSVRFQAFLSRQVGTRRELLLEKPLKNRSGYWQGHTENFVPAVAQIPQGKAKQIVSVEVTGTSGEMALARALRIDLPVASRSF